MEFREVHSMHVMYRSVIHADWIEVIREKREATILVSNAADEAVVRDLSLQNVKKNSSLFPSEMKFRVRRQRFD